jgi:GNAT superfamily N-acetyltransferase
MSLFKRPVNLEFPHTYCTFTAKDRGSDEMTEYRIQDIPEDRFGEAVDMMTNVFLPDEPLSDKILNSPESVKTARITWMKALQQRVSLGCFRNDGSDELVGMNVLEVHTRDDPEDDTVSNFCEYVNNKFIYFLPQIDDENVLQICGLFEYTTKLADIYNKYNVDRYLSAFGLVVDRPYRGCGLARHILHARIPLMQYIGISVTVTSFTSIPAQTAAKNAGFEELYVKR